MNDAEIEAMQVAAALAAVRAHREPVRTGLSEEELLCGYQQPPKEP